MLFKSTGQVRDNFYILGLAAYPVHLLDSPLPVLFDGGTSCAGKLYVEAIRLVLGTRQPAVLFLTHAHWDHCGAVFYLKEAFPDMKIAASRQTAQILKKPGALELIAKLNKDAQGLLRAASGLNSSQLLDGTFRPFDIDIEIGNKQAFDLGDGSTVEVLATPGHTRDHHSYYLPDKKILIAGDSAGCLDSSGGMVCEFLYDYDAYISTIARLAHLSVEVLCQGHRVVLVGRDQVKAFFESSLREAIRFKDQVYQLLEEERGSIDRVVQRIKAVRYDILPEPKQPEIPYLLNLTAKVKHLAGKKAKL
jgi:glyoxylase-like metal-dependent hydrolase (beta-lactamase superfamily II)